MAHKTHPGSKTNSGEGEQVFGLLFESHPIPMFVYDLKTLAILQVNEAMIETCGYSREEFQTLALKDIIPVEDITRLLDAIKKNLQHSGGWHNRLKNGQIIEVEVTSHTLEFEGHQAILVMAQDVTERKRAEIELQHHKKDLELINALNEIINRGDSLDTFTKKLTGETQRIFSASNCTISLLSPDEQYLITQHLTLPASLIKKIEQLIGRSLPQIQIPIKEGSYLQKILQNEQGTITSDPKLIQQWMMEFTQATQLSPEIRGAIQKLVPQIYKLLDISSTITVPLISNKKTIGLLDLSSKGLFTEDDLHRIHNISSQVTAAILRKQDEEALSASEAELRTLLSSMQDVVLVIGRDGVYRKIAPTNPNLLVKPSDELLGRNLRDVFPAEQAETFLASIRRVVDTQKPIRVEYQLLIGERLVWFAASVSPMEADCTLWVARDITERKQADAALRESEERYHTLFDSMMDGIYRSTHAGKFVDVNPAMVKMFGYSSKEEMLAVDIKKELYFSPEERGSHILDTGQEEIEVYRMRRKDGSEIWVEDHGYYIHDEHGRPIYHEGMLRDITARKHTEETLLKLKKAVDTSTEAIFLTDKDGIFTYINPGFTALYGYSAGEVVGKVTPRILKSGLLSPQVYVQFWKTLLGGQEVKGELINKRKNGKLVDIDGSATPILDDTKNIIGFLGIQHDITERKQAEEALQVAEANFRSIFENATVGIYQSTPQGRFLSVNPVMARTFGFDLPDEMLNSIVSIEKQYVDPETRREFQRRMVEEGEVREFTSWNYRKNGERIWIQESARAVKDAQGNILYYEGFVSDITKRKQSEDELHRAKESLELANRELEHVLMREQQLARTDGLTGLHNYRYFFELASREFSASIRYRRPLAILMFDTDNFKQVNDTLGHTAGDKILALVAQTTTAQMRVVDVLARYGGDEFVVLLSQTSAQQAFPIAERIRTGVAALHMKTGKVPLTITLSIGIAEIWHDPADETVESIVQRADKALYAAKQAGRNRTVIFRPE